MNRSDDDRANQIEALDEALGQLATATKAGSIAGQFDAHLALSDLFARKAMIVEATRELDAASKTTLPPTDQARFDALNARSATLALQRGDYDRAEKLMDGKLWFQRFLSSRDRGSPANNEADVLKKLAESNEVQSGLLTLALRVDLDPQTSTVGAYADLFPFAGQLAIAPEMGSLGPVDRYLALIAAQLGRLDDAQHHLESAIRISDRNGLLPWGARARADLSRVLLARGRAGDQELSASYLAAARSTAQEIGLVGIESKAPEPAAAASVPAASAQPTARPNVFRRDGEYWTIAFADSAFSLRDTKGLLYLAKLLAAPDREIHSLDLVRGSRSDEAATEVVRVESAAAGDFTTDPFASAGDVIDAEAREEYRRRLAEIDAEIGQAQDWNDPVRAERLNEERDFLIRELAGAVGLGGVSRTVSSASERARISVTKAIWSSVDRITSHGPELGRHLTLSVHTGTYCSYTPDPALKIVWEL